MNVSEPLRKSIRHVPRVGLNAHLLGTGANYRSAGLSRYIDCLLCYLPEADAGLEYLAFVGDGRITLPGCRTRASLWRTVNPMMRILWEQSAQPWEAWREGLDLLHLPVCVGPLVAPCPMVVTVHDLSFYLYPELLPRFNRFYLQRFTRLTAERAVRVIADSASTQGDIVRTLGIAADKISVIHLGVGDEMHPVADPAALTALRKCWQLPEHFILYLGTLEPRKNLPTLLEAYSLLRRAPGFAWTLVIAGGKGWYYDQIDATVQRLGLREQVLFPGYIPQAELALWYSAADLMVYPSLYEGFGLPPLEAMACGTPVVTSNASSLPEAVGEAGLMVDPHDPAALAQAMRLALEDPAQRRTMRELGLARARRFTWRATALATAQLYHQILGDTQTHGS